MYLLFTKDLREKLKDQENFSPQLSGHDSQCQNYAASF